MWTLSVVAVSLLVMTSLSPFFAILGLIVLAGTLGASVGLAGMNWFFYILIIVYLGGMMVMFIYLASLMQEKKIPPMNGLVWLGGLALPALLILSATTSESSAISPLWVQAGFWGASTPVLVFMVFYLLVTLVSVYRVCEKTSGPMKSSGD